MQNAETMGTPLLMWTVGAPTQTTMLLPTGTYSPAWQIPVTMADGSGFIVEVSAKEFTPDKVKQLIEEHVNKILAIRALEGPAL